MKRPLRAAALILAFLLSPAPACGPWLPSAILADRRAPLKAPLADFTGELLRLRPLPALPVGILAKQAAEDPAQIYPPEPAEVERAELPAIWEHYHIAAQQRERLTRAYAEAREIVNDNGNKAHDSRRAPARANAGKLAGINEALDLLPADFPAELTDYLRGAAAFRCHDYAAARVAWERLLARHAEQRKYRAASAAYMLGRMAQLADYQENAAEARGWFQRTRALIAEGAADVHHVAASSFGWEAYYGLEPAEKLRLYLLELQAGGENARGNLAKLADGMLREADTEKRAAIARDPLFRKLVATYLVQGGSYRRSWQEEGPDAAWIATALQWFETVATVSPDGADVAPQLAWSAYQCARYDLAARWLRHAPTRDPVACWLRAKLALREGQPARAAQQFSLALPHFPAGPTQSYTAHEEDSGLITDAHTYQLRQFYSDAGATFLARADFTQALSALLQSGYWIDAAYVAEHVLSTEELFTFVRQHPAPRREDFIGPLPEEQNGLGFFGPPQFARESLAYLLARRLAREGRHREAARFFPAELRIEFDQFARDYARGHRTSLSRAERGRALWAAAQRQRRLGMEFFGTETAPDWAYYEGAFEEPDLATARASQILLAPGPEHGSAVDDDGHHPWVLPASHAELTRATRHRPTPNHRFHYRYTAAALAWRAAMLLPNNDELTARILATAGLWLNGRDPKAADPFYIALVRRCPQTTLGHLATLKDDLPVWDDLSKERE